MAARLMHRWYWVYRTFSPLGHQAGPLSQATWSNRPPFASRTTYNLSQVADRFSVKELESKTPEKSTRWDDLIMASSTMEELLAPEHLHNISGNQAALLITRLSHLASQLKLDHEDILKDKRFQQLLHHTYKEASRIHHPALINLLKSLYFLGVSPQQKELRSAEQELRWRLRGLSYRRLASLATYLSAYVPREKPHELLTELLAQLEMQAFRRQAGYPHGFGVRLREAEFPPDPDVPEDLLGPPAPHLRVASHRCGPLCEVLLLPQMVEPAVLRCVKSSPYHKWLTLPFFEASAELVNLLVSYARLNFQPSNKEDFYTKSHHILDGQLGSLNPSLLVDLVWSLCVLQQAETVHFQMVLLPKFFSSFFGMEGRKKGMDRNRKRAGERKGGKRGREERTEIGQEREKEERREGGREGRDRNKTREGEGREVKELDAGPSELLAQTAAHQHHSPAGVSRLRRALLTAREADLPGSGGRPDPHSSLDRRQRRPHQGGRQVAFLLWEFPNFSSRSKDLLGRFMMERRHLQTAGFVVV
ncbi:Protein TBRG4, partial [Ophiophagus hannah]